MKKFAAVLALGLALAAGNASADAIMQSAYDNTIVVTAPNGVVLRYHFNADGTYDFVTPDAQTVTGVYTLANGQICLTPTGGQPACAQYAGDKNVGDTWTQVGADGSQISVSVVAGRP